MAVLFTSVQGLQYQDFSTVHLLPRCPAPPRLCSSGRCLQFVLLTFFCSQCGRGSLNLAGGMSCLGFAGRFVAPLRPRTALFLSARQPASSDLHSLRAAGSPRAPLFFSPPFAAAPRCSLCVEGGGALASHRGRPLGPSYSSLHPLPRWQTLRSPTAQRGRWMVQFRGRSFSLADRGEWALLVFFTGGRGSG